MITSENSNVVRARISAASYWGGRVSAFKYAPVLYLPEISTHEFPDHLQGFEECGLWLRGDTNRTALLWDRRSGGISKSKH